MSWLWLGAIVLGTVPNTAPGNNRNEPSRSKSLIRWRRPPEKLRQELEVIYDDLGAMTEIRGIAIWLPVNIKSHAHSLRSSCRNFGCERMSGHYRGSRRSRSSGGDHSDPAGLPNNCVLQLTRRGCEPRDINRHEGGLDGKLGILVIRITPTTNIDIEFTVILFISRMIPGEHSEHGCRL